MLQRRDVQSVPWATRSVRSELAVGAGLLAGAAVVATAIIAVWPSMPTAAASHPAAAPASRPCKTQTWPYIDAACAPAHQGELRQVRLISTDRGVPRVITVLGRAPNPTESTTAAQAAAPAQATMSTALMTQAAPSIAPTQLTQNLPAPEAKRSHRSHGHDARFARTASRAAQQPLAIHPGAVHADPSVRVLAYSAEPTPPRFAFPPFGRDFGVR